jgi:hypothetical protein
VQEDDFQEILENAYRTGGRLDDTVLDDLEALTTYAMHEPGREWRTTPARLSVVTTEPASATVEVEPEEAGTRPLRAAMASDRM